MNTSITPAPVDQPYRGDGDGRPDGVPLPPAHLPLLRGWHLRKSWHYVAFFSRELSFCASRVIVGLLPQEYWGIWDRAAGKFRDASHMLTHRIQIEPNRVRMRDGDVEIDVVFGQPTGFEVYAPVEGAYIWSHKDFCWQAKGTVSYGGTTQVVDGVVFVDINAGYHPRHTQWRWMAGAGRDQNDRLVGFNLTAGVFDSPVNSERAVCTEAGSVELAPVTFSEDLATVSFAEGGELHFTPGEPKALIEHHDNLVLIRADYFHWFGSFSGTLPGGIELREAFGVRERQDAWW